jgi:hypothetical protein
MKRIFSKTVLACSIAAASLFAASAAQADVVTVFNPFTVSHTEGTVVTTFTADKITGNYNEVISFDGLGGFAVSLYWTAGQFVTNGGNDAIEAGDSRLGVDYGLYGTYMAKGTVVTTAGKTTFTFTPGSGSLNLFLDENRNTTKTNPVNGVTPFTKANFSDDVLIATGDPISGAGNLDPSLSTCGPGKGINCGSFGSTTSFALTVPNGTAFFIAPQPFYDLSFQSGQLNNFTLSGTQTINGSLDVTFGRVPEPSTTALFGLGLLGLGFTARRRKQS